MSGFLYISSLSGMRKVILDNLIIGGGKSNYAFVLSKICSLTSSVTDNTFIHNVTAASKHGRGFLACPLSSAFAGSASAANNARPYSNCSNFSILNNQKLITMNKKLLKMMLVAVGMVAGTVNSWGQETTIFEQDFTPITLEGATEATTEPKDYGFVQNAFDGSLTSAKVIDGKFTSIVGGNKEKGTTDFYKTFDVIGSGNILKLSLYWETGGATGKSKSSCSQLYLSDEEGNKVLELTFYGQDQRLYVNGIEATTLSRNSKINVSATLNLSTNIIEELNVGSFSDKNIAFKNTVTGISRFGFYHTTGVKLSWQNTSSIDNIKITYEKITADIATYKVNVITENGDILKTETRSGNVGESPILKSEDKEDLYNTEKTKKYIYVNDDSETKSITKDGSTVVTITYREAATYTYTVNAVGEDGNVLQTLGNGTFFEGESARAYYPKAININGKWYMNDGNKDYPTYGIDFKEESNANIVYYLADIAYYADVENLHQSSPFVAAGGYPERYSKGKAGRLGKNSYAYTDAFTKTKTYTLYLWGRNNAGSSVANIALGLRDAEGNITDLENTFEDWDKGASALKSVTDVTIPAGYSLVLRNSNTEYNSNLEMDYIYLVEQVPATVSANISAAEYATFVTDYNMVAPSTVKTYAVKANAEKTGIELSEIAAGTVIPANTALLLNASEGTYDFTVSTEDAATIENNALVPATTDVTATGNEYALTKQDGKVGFAQVETGVVIPAGKAYLVVDNSEENAAKFLTFGDGELTGVNSVKTADADNGAYYTLQGVKTVKPVKGMYIHNGKKVIKK